MSANQDKSQRFRFVFPKSSKDGEITSPIQASLPPQVQVIKTGKKSLKPQPQVKVEGRVYQIRPFHPAEFIQNRIKKKTVGPVESIKKNLNQLSDLHSRLRFMLTELEELHGTSKKDDSGDDDRGKNSR